MSAIFPKWTNRLPIMVVIGGLLACSAAVAGAWYYLTPKYSRVGYQPIQPVAFSHIPGSATCMNCHTQVLKDDPRLALVRESALSGKPIPWVQIHRVPDYVYFNHSVHVNRGVSCVECHGPINKMEEVYHFQPLSMTFCLDCHRDPAAKLRPQDKITNLDWKWDANNPEENARLQKLHGEKMVRDYNIKPEGLQTCSTCHR